ncbi:MAG: ATP-binding protein [Actinomyces ruminicola]|nr:ATP-binding protein [Actinomyces ruminicola]
MPAPSNRARVGRAIEIVADALEPWINGVVSPKLPPGVAWTDLLAQKDGRTDRTYSPSDLQCQLRLITERMGNMGFVVSGVLSRGEQNLAGELRDIRNNWAHNNPFSTDDTYRALDTAERLLRAINAPAEADQIRRMKQDSLRHAYDAATRRDTRATAVAMPDLGEKGLDPWRDVVRPHPDILSGDYGQAEYAADLHQVAHGQGSEEYVEPVRFFERTYLTQGLKTLLRMTARRLSKDPNAQAVVNLQTTFGGGKTHSMLAAWHLAGGTPLEQLPQDVQELLSGTPIPKGVSRVAIVGNEISPGQPTRKPDGTVVHTLWGELAWQLGGTEGYALVEQADRTGTNPGAALRTLIADHAPALILIDEWVAYARGLYGREGLAGGSFDTQFTFAQELTAAVQGVPGALLLVSIPASDIREDGTVTRASELEIGGDGGREALQRLQHVVARVAHNWSPASSGESFEIVRRRLFTDLDADGIRKRDATVKRFVEYYRGQRGELPPETFQPDYERRLRDSYPIHPELFDRLYGDWSSLERFQRTRGVLRLMSAVVHSLAQAGDDAPLIMPGSIPFDDAAVRDEIAGYLDDAWRTIIETDVDGENATPLGVDRDRELFGKRALTRRIARTLFLGSAATLDTAHKGIDRQRIFLGVAMPGDTLGNFGSALQLLTDRATYVYTQGTRSWYDRQPSLNRMVTDRAGLIDAADVAGAAVSVLRGIAVAGRAPEFADVIVAPTSTGDVPDAQEATLVILGPAHTVVPRNGRGSQPAGPGRDFTEELMRSRGSAPRSNVNALIAVAPEGGRWADAEQALRIHMAWSQMAEETSIRDHDLTVSQADQARRKAQETRGAAERAVAAAWIWALYPVQDDGSRPPEIEALRIDGEEQRIAVRAGTRLGKQDLILTALTPTAIALELQGPNLRAKWNEGRIAVGELWSYFTRYPYMPRLRDKRVLLDAVASVMNDIGWESVGFALAADYDASHGDFIDLRLPLEDEAPRITDTTLLVSPALARAQRGREEERAGAADTTEAASVKTDSGTATRRATTGAAAPRDGGAATSPTERPRVANVRFKGVAELDPGRDVAAQLAQLAEEVIAHLRAGGADALSIEVDIEASRYNGFNADTVRTVTENARTLGIKPGRFTEE